MRNFYSGSGVPAAVDFNLVDSIETVTNDEAIESMYGWPDNKDFLAWISVSRGNCGRGEIAKVAGE